MTRIIAVFLILQMIFCNLVYTQDYSLLAPPGFNENPFSQGSISSDDIADRIARLGRISKLSYAEINNDDKNFIKQIALHYNISLNDDLEDKNYLAKVKALQILLNAELHPTIIDFNDILTTIFIDRISNAFFIHEFMHVTDDIFAMNLVLRNIEAIKGKGSVEAKEIQKYLDLFKHHNEMKNSIMYILLDLKKLMDLAPSIIIPIIDDLVSFFETVKINRVQLKGYIKTLSSNIGGNLATDNRVKTYMQIAEKNTDFLLDYLKQLKHDILNPVHSVPININESIKEVVNQYQSFTWANIDSKYDENIPPINVNPTKFLYLCRNLMSNAIEAIGESNTGESRMEIFTKLEHKFGHKGIIIEFWNDGDCIPSELLKDGRLFQKGVTTKINGSGMGLHIVKSIVDEYNGTIQVSSSKEEGTLFRIEFPIPDIRKPSENLSDLKSISASM